MKVSFDFWKFEKDMEERIEEAMEEAMDLAKEEIESLTPEDSQTLLKGYDKEPIENQDGKITGRIVNNTPYGIYVELWVRGTPYNYHKPKGIVNYRGVGARMMTRTADNKADELRAIFLSKVSWKK